MGGGGEFVEAGDQFEIRPWPVKSSLGSDGVPRTHGRFEYRG